MRRPPISWPQAFPFTCGPAALGSVLLALGWAPKGSRLEEELALWRESTAVACPGAHPFGLALAARRRGFAPHIEWTGPRPWLAPHVRTRHDGTDTDGYRAIERLLRHQCVAEGVVVREAPSLPTGGRGSGLLLTSTADDAADGEDPHWIGVLPAESGGVFVLDPLRSGTAAPRRSWRAVWRSAGFQGTRCWLGIAPTPGAARADRLSPRREGSGSARRGAQDP